MGPQPLVIVTETLDWGGTERVVQSVAERYPDAPILAAEFAGLLAPEVAEQEWFSRARRVRLDERKRHFLAPVYARRMAAAQLGPADVVLAFAHHGWALGVEPPDGARSVCYCAGLPKVFYGRAGAYLAGYPAPARAAARALLPALRAHHRRLIRRPDRLLTNSRASAADIARVHGRRAEVVHPPVLSSFFTPGSGAGRHALAVGRLVAHKRFDVLVEAFRGLGEELVIAGHGRELERLRASAPPNVHFTGFVSDEELRELYRDSFALVCPSVEEFGIAMAEAQACGVPVVAPAAGGALEIVETAQTGILVERLDAGSLAAGVRSARERQFDPDACRASAERFSDDRFTARIERVIGEELERAGRRGYADAVPVVAASH